MVEDLGDRRALVGVQLQHPPQQILDLINGKKHHKDSSHAIHSSCEDAPTGNNDEQWLLETTRAWARQAVDDAGKGWRKFGI